MTNTGLSPEPSSSMSFAHPRPILEIQNLRKSFGGTIALNGVNLLVEYGETHGLIGENGAGKSTLIKSLCGIVKPDSGQINFLGRPYSPQTPRDAKALGLQVVHQEFNLLPQLSVAENISIEHLPRNVFGVVKQKQMNDLARSALDAIGLTDIDVRWPVERLGIAHRQLVEIARALMADSKLLILDEPTATLTARETERLFSIIGDLKKRGVSVIFVSHHLDEIFRICDRVTVLRNGETMFARNITGTTQDELVRGMVGKDLQRRMSGDVTSSTRPDVAMSLRSFRHALSPHANGITFDLQRGEILGIAGLVGSGRTELLRAIAGAEKAVSGSLCVDGRLVTFRSPRQAINAGIGFVTEDRKDQGLIMAMPIAANVSLATMASVSKGGLINKASELALTKRFASDLRLKYGGPEKSVSTLSGGNQQKVVLAKWLARNPEILLLDEPTRGVDVGAKAEIYTLIRELAGRGLALLVVSSELPELMTLCDRIIVMSHHRIVGEVRRADYSEEKILSYAYAGEKRRGEV